MTDLDRKPDIQQLTFKPTDYPRPRPAAGGTIAHALTEMDFGYTFVTLDPGCHRLPVLAPAPSRLGTNGAPLSDRPCGSGPPDNHADAASGACERLWRRLAMLAEGLDFSCSPSRESFISKRFAQLAYLSVVRRGSSGINR